MTKQKKQRLALFSAGAIIILCLAVLSARQPEPKPPSEAGTIYFSGPRFNRNTGKWVTAEGKIVPPPPGENPHPTRVFGLTDSAH